MIFKKPLYPIQEKKSKEPDNKKDFPTLADLMVEQGISNDTQHTVHRRRDLDSLG